MGELYWFSYRLGLVFQLLGWIGTGRLVEKEGKYE